MEQKEFNQLCFISESGSQIGYGHLYRSIALAKEFLNKGYEVEFSVSDKIAEALVLQHLVKINFITFSSLEKNISKYRYVFLDVFKNSWVNYKDLILKNFSKTRFVSIIDFPFLEYAIQTDYIFSIGFQDYNFREEVIIGESDKNIKILSGNDFFIFREEFSKVKLPEIRKEIENIFISMGGSDPQNLTSLVINGLDKIGEKLHLDVILGAGYGEKRFNKLKNSLNNIHHSVKIHKNISDISTLMMKSDLAIINGGNTRFELALLGIPFISIALNEKQKEISDYSMRHGIGQSLGVYEHLHEDEIAEYVKNLSIDFEKRKNMSTRMKETISANGTKNIYSNLF
jgi:spore coat polysaccharide biosynthesis predicted glycosyltransferase SpsG